VGSIYAAAGSGGAIREIGIFNTTAVPVAIRLARLTTQGTPGAGLTEDNNDPNGPPALCTAFDTHSVGPTIGADLGKRAVLGAAVGAGIIWTFGASGLVIPKGTANGIGIVVIGTGQILDWYMDWDE